MFYFEQDRREIRGWLKTADDKVREELREEIQEQIRKQQGNFITNQQLVQYVAQYDVELQSNVRILVGDKVRENNIRVTDKVDAVRKAFDAFVADDFDRLKNSADATAQEVKALTAKVDKLQAPPPAQPTADVDALTKKVAELSAENDALKKQLAQHDQNFAVVTKALNDIQKNFVGLLQQRDAQILSLKAEVDKLKAAQPSPQPPVEVDELKAEVDALKSKVDELERRLPEPPEPPIDDGDKFFLLVQSDEFLPADRKQIPAKIKTALDMRDLEQFLTEHPSTTSTQFQKILNNHAKEVKKFVDKLKLNDLDNDELSETVTAKYFKLFQRTIFDNLLIAIRRGFKASDKSANAFYSEFLKLLNQYLMRCGIYSLNVTKDRRADSDDYENMTPQVIKTADETLAGTIDSIERLPYRINYRDEFGEQKFFQYAGIMNVYKAV